MAILVCPLAHVPSLARERKPSHVVSLLDPGTPFPKLAMDDRHLRLEIHDVEVDIEGACGGDHVRTILDFVGRWQGEAPILIHCYAGISRSTATAFITACVHNPHMDEEAIALALRQASVTASPNRRFIALADAELGRGGRMSKAIEKIGRGASWWETGDAQPFSLTSKFV